MPTQQAMISRTEQNQNMTVNDLDPCRCPSTFRHVHEALGYGANFFNTNCTPACFQLIRISMYFDACRSISVILDCPVTYSLIPCIGQTFSPPITQLITIAVSTSLRNSTFGEAEMTGTNRVSNQQAIMVQVHL